MASAPKEAKGKKITVAYFRNQNFWDHCGVGVNPILYYPLHPKGCAVTGS